MTARRAALLAGGLALAGAGAILFLSYGRADGTAAREAAELAAAEASRLAFVGFGAAGAASGSACALARASESEFAGPKGLPEFEPAPFPAQQGERLLYSVSWLGVGAGTIEFRVGAREIRDGVECLVVEMAMDSTSALVDAVYPVRERARSWVDVAGTFTRGYEIERLHRRIPVRDAQTFDYARGVSECLTTKRGKTSRSEALLDGPAQDSISWVYYVRARIASGASTARFTMIQRSKRWEVGLAIDGVEEIDLRSRGRVSALGARGGASLASIFGREDGEAEGVRLWFEPASGIMLAARVKAPVGDMRLELIRAERPGGGIGGDDGRVR